MRHAIFRLPVKSLIKCTPVCTTWRSIIKNPSFILPHLSRTVHCNNLNDSDLLLLHKVSGKDSATILHKVIVFDVMDEVFSLLYDNQAFDEYSKIKFPIAPKLHNPHLRVVGTCNGLVCLADDSLRYGYNFFIWNPAIRKLLTLPRPGVTYSTHGAYDASIGFGFDAMTNDYKVVRLVYLMDRECEEGQPLTVAEVYSLATGSWNSLGSVTPSCQMYGAVSQAFVNGALHWPAVRWTKGGKSNFFILTFDMGSELFREIPVPKSLICDRELGLRLSVSGDGKSIALFTMDNMHKDCFLDIWVMKEYGREKSWTKLITLGPQGPDRLLPRGLCFRKSGEVLLELCGAREEFHGNSLDYFYDKDRLKLRHELVSLDLVSKQIKNLGISLDGYQYCSVNSYKASPILLDKTDAVSY